MRLRPWSAIAGAATVLALVTAGVGSASADHDDRRSPTTLELEERTWLRLDDGLGPFVGADGLLYDRAPKVVDGLGGESFFGLDFDLACGDRGSLGAGLRRIAKLARVIERSGRRVVFAVAPNKTGVDAENIDFANLPHGVCTSIGLRQVNNVLDRFQDPNYLPLRRKLAADKRTVYWLTDAHWTTVGSSVFARVLAKKLDPRLVRHQKYVRSSRTIVGDLNRWRGIDTPETAEALLPAKRVKVRTAPGSLGFDPHVDYAVDYTHSWISGPKARTWPGRTLLVGDSFMLRGLESLRPVFRKGTFLWMQPWMIPPIAKAIPASDTVVFEVAQMFVQFSILTSPQMRAAVRDQLKQAAPRDSARAPSRS